MAYLNLFELMTDSDLTVTPGVGRGAYGQELSRVEARLPAPALEKLQAKLQEAFAEGVELRVDLTSQFTVFCRAVSDAPARLLLARPEAGAFVATLSLPPAAWEKSWNGQSLRGVAESLHPSSNLDWTWIAAR